MSDGRKDGEQFEKLKQFLDANKGDGIIACAHPDNAELVRPLELLEGCTVKLSEFVDKTDDKGEAVIYLMADRYTTPLVLDKPIEFPKFDAMGWNTLGLWRDGLRKKQPAGDTP